MYKLVVNTPYVISRNIDRFNENIIWLLIFRNRLVLLTKKLVQG